MNTTKYLNYFIDNKILYKLSIFLLFIIIAMIFLSVDPAHASTSGTAMPWEGPLTDIANSLRGPVAFSISLIGMVVCGAMLVFGGELGDFARKMVMLVLAISVMAFGSSAAMAIFNIGSTVIS